MRRMMWMALAVLMAAGPARAEEYVYVLRTQENAAVPAVCPAGDNVRLGAFVYVPRTHPRSGLVREDLGRPIGTAVGCGVMTSLATYNFTAPAPFSMAFDLGKGGRSLMVNASGYCLVADQSFPIPGVPAPLLLVGCTLTVHPDPSQGIVRGTATSSSVFMPVALPGFQTGSIWTVRLYAEDGSELDLEE